MTADIEYTRSTPTMKIGHCYKLVGDNSICVERYETWEETSALARGEVRGGRKDPGILIPPNTNQTFMVVAGPVYAPFGGDDYPEDLGRSESKREVVGYKLIAPGAVGWFYAWADEPLHVHGIVEVTKSRIFPT